MTAVKEYISKEDLIAKIDEEREHLIANKQFGAEHILTHYLRELVENAPVVLKK